MPKFSVIIPVYNVAQYLPQCIESILSQKFTDFELLLIDDGSFDGSASICDKYSKKDSRIRVYHKINEGVSKARNYGIDKADGQWICFADADDWVDPGWLSNYITEEDVDACFYIDYCGNNENEYKDMAVLSSEQIMKMMFNFEIQPSLWYGCFSLAKISTLRLSENIHHYEDYEFLVKFMANVGSVRILKKNFYHYRMRIGSATHSDINDKVMSCLLISDTVKDLKGLSVRDFKNIKVFFYLQCVFYLLKSDKVNEIYYHNLIKYARMNIVSLLTASWPKKSYKIISFLSIINIKLLYSLLHSTYTNRLINR